MYGFESYYWKDSELGEEDRQATTALNLLSPELPSAGYATSDRDGLLAAYRVLLHSDDMRARGVALDQYFYANAQTRWGQDNPLIVYDAEVLAEARAMLAVPPTDPSAVSCRLSGVGVLSLLGEGTDLPRLLGILDSDLAAEVIETDITFSWALTRCLLDADEPTCRRTGARLAGLFSDDSVPFDMRLSAIGPFLDNQLEDRLGQQDALVRLLDHDDIRLSIHAAWALADRDGYQPVVRRTVAAWPADAPYPADEVRRIFDDADRLIRARALLASPSVEPATLLDALDAVAGLGDSTDLGHLLRILDGTDLTANAKVSEALVKTVDRRLDDADEATRRQVATRFAAVFADERLPKAVRAAAIRPFWDDLPLSGQEPALIGLLEHDEVDLSAAAAYALMEREEYLPLVRRAAASWPEGGPIRVRLVREHLAR